MSNANAKGRSLRGQPLSLADIFSGTIGVVAMGVQHYHDSLDGALLPQFAHDAFQLNLPLRRQLLAAEVISGLVQQFIRLCSHLLQRILLQLILCEHCIGQQQTSACCPVQVVAVAVCECRDSNSIE